MRKKTIDIPIYFGELKIIKCKNLKKVYKKYDLGKYKNQGAISFGTFKNGYTIYYIAFSTDYTDNRTIAHECLHTVGKIFYDRCIYMDITNDEPQCYLLGWLVDECNKFLKISPKKLGKSN